MMLNNAYDLFTKISKNNKEPILCWPDHFVLATTVFADKKIPVKIGFCPGDEDYIEPYFFVSKDLPHPLPAVLPELKLGLWHKKDWFGAILTISEIMNIDDEKELIQRQPFYKIFRRIDKRRIVTRDYYLFFRNQPMKELKYNSLSCLLIILIFTSNNIFIYHSFCTETPSI